MIYAFISILLWSSLAALSQKLLSVPPFLLVALSLGIGSLLSIGKIKEWFVRPALLLFGVTGIFVYHFFLFLAFRLAPAIEVNLINYLWPVFIVLMSVILLPQTRLNRYHVLGGLLAFSGAGMVLTGGKVSFQWEYLTGYLLALGAALVWACYSVLTKRWASFASATVGGFCFFSSVLALLCHRILENPYSPTSSEWVYILILGVGPMGIAFYSWDAGLKRADPRRIGILSYLTPFLSTLFLSFALGQSFISPAMMGALVLIVAGAFVSSLKPS